MEIGKNKFVVTVYNSKLEYNGETFKEVLSKETAATWKKATSIAEKLKKKFSKNNYPKREIVIKQRYREGWKVVSTRT